jgi:hypothetical protein
MGHQKGIWGAVRQVRCQKGTWGAVRHVGRQKGIWGAVRHVGHHKADGVPNRHMILKTLCHWLGMKSKAGADDLLSLTGDED